MNRSITIGEVMTESPHCIEADEPLHRASEMMVRHSIRHLPVLDGGTPFGIISERDIQLARSLLQHAAQEEELKVREVCTTNFYGATPDVLVSDVADVMSRERIGSALIIDTGTVQGIFTAVDACRCLSEVLKEV